MGWHDAREIPNYWAYAQNFVLQDKMFEPTCVLESACTSVHGVCLVCQVLQDG